MTDPAPHAPEPLSRQIIVTLFGLYARLEHDWLSVASLIHLMGELGAPPSAVRSSISRLKRRNVLRSLSVDGVAGYTPAGETLDIIAEGDHRIFDAPRARSSDGWVLAVFSVPERERDKRHALRTTLVRLGCGAAAPGVWLAPGHLATQVQSQVERSGLSEYVELFAAHHLAFGDMRANVRKWWDLGAIAGAYTAFDNKYRPVLTNLERADKSGRGRAAEAFAEYIPMLTSWRRLPYLDPGLPLELLPGDWPGIAAGELFGELNSALRAPARRHAMKIIRG